jgi:hypothetical protein
MGIKGQRDLVHLKSATFLQSRTPPTAVTRQSQLVWATRGTLKRTGRSIRTASRIEKLAVYQAEEARGWTRHTNVGAKTGLDSGMLLLRKAPVNVPKSSKIIPSVPRRVSWTSKLLFSRPRSLLLHCHELAEPAVLAFAAVQPAHSNIKLPLSLLQASVHGLSSYLYLSIKLIQYSRTQNRRRL